MNTEVTQIAKEDIPRYELTRWENGTTPLSETNLNNIEDGLNNLTIFVGDVVSSTINAEIKARTDGLAAEILARKAADDNLAGKISDEITARKAADDSLADRIADEITARTKTDNNLAKEIEDRKKTDKNLAAEIEARQSEDNKLLQKVSQIESNIETNGVTKDDLSEYITIDELTSKNYATESFVEEAVKNNISLTEDFISIKDTDLIISCGTSSE